MKRNPQILGQFHQAIGDSNHPALRKKRADVVFQMRNDVHRCGRLVGIGAVVGGVAVE